MSTHLRMVRTEFGTVPFETKTCDECNTETVENEAVGWISTKSMGVPVQTMSSVPMDGKDFCSQPCLIKYVSPRDAVVGA